MQIPVDDLLDEITAWPAGMPVRAMERVLEMGEPAAGPVAEALARWADDEARDVLWLVVLLGRLGGPDAVDALRARLDRPDESILALAAAEALAAIGEAALPTLLEAVEEAREEVRLYAYGALGWIDDDRARGALREALEDDVGLADVVGPALAEHGRPDDVERLHEALSRVEPWQRVELEEAIASLHGDGPGDEPPPPARNWRTRYRRIPAIRTFDPGWLGIAAIVHGEPGLRRSRAHREVRPLEAILEEAERAAWGERTTRTCEECGERVEAHTGVPVCPETAVGAAVVQHQILGEARDAGVDDVYALRDATDARLWEAVGGGVALDPDEEEDLAFTVATCDWLIERGVVELGPARALLLAEAGRLAHRFGDPAGLLSRPPAPVETPGRNDPCPCGSGRKYKRCCGNPARPSANGSP